MENGVPTVVTKPPMTDDEFVVYVRKNVVQCLVLGREWKKSAHPGYNSSLVAQLINEEAEYDFQLPNHRTKPWHVADDIEGAYERAFAMDKLKKNKKLQESYKLFKDSEEFIDWDGNGF